MIEFLNIWADFLNFFLDFYYIIKLNECQFLYFEVCYEEFFKS